MSKTNSVRARIDAAFQQIAAILKQEEHNDASLFAMIAQSALDNPQYAHVLALNIAGVLDEQKAEVDYADVLVEAYRRTLFQRDDEKYTFFDAFNGDPVLAEQFAENVKRMMNPHNIVLAAPASARRNLN